jgi:hypothetical protein
VGHDRPASGNVMRVERQVITQGDKKLCTEYILVTPHASKPMHIRIYPDGDVTIRGRSTKHQLELMFEAILRDQIRV